MEKPTKIEVGQLWRHERSTGPRTVEMFDRGTATFDTGSVGFQPTMLEDPKWTYLGWADGYGPQPPDTGRVEFAKPEACRCARAAACGSEPHDCGFCGGRCPGGAAPQPVPEVVPHTPRLANTRLPPDRSRRVSRLNELYDDGKISFADAVDAMIDIATPCLQAISARKKPEPWVPSVDDFDLLPDA